MKLKDVIEKSMYIKCNNQSEFDTLLEFAEQNGCKWASGGNPTLCKKYYNAESCNYVNFAPSYLIYNLVTDKIRNGEYINFTELDLNITEKYSLEIKRKGRKVIATLFDENNVFVKSSKAICHPDDTFDFDTGKEIALQKLFRSEFEDLYEIEKLKLTMFGENKGIVGKPTKVELLGGIKLCVGDVVELFNGEISYGLHCVCKPPHHLNTDGFVMDAACIKFLNGHGNDMHGNTLHIIKRISYKEMRDGDVISNVRYEKL